MKLNRFNIITGDKIRKIFSENVLTSHNLKKGSTDWTGFMHTTGDIILIQDADLEYDPTDYLNY